MDPGVRLRPPIHRPDQIHMCIKQSDDHFQTTQELQADFYHAHALLGDRISSEKKMRISDGHGEGEQNPCLEKLVSSPA